MLVRGVGSSSPGSASKLTAGILKTIHCYEWFLVYSIHAKEMFLAVFKFTNDHFDR